MAVEHFVVAGLDRAGDRTEAPMLRERDQLVVELDRPAHRVVAHHERPTIQGVRISLSVSFAAEQNDPRHGGCGHVPRVSPTESQQANPAIVNAGSALCFIAAWAAQHWRACARTLP